MAFVGPMEQVSSFVPFATHRHKMSSVTIVHERGTIDNPFTWAYLELIQSQPIPELIYSRGLEFTARPWYPVRLDCCNMVLRKQQGDETQLFCQQTQTHNYSSPLSDSRPTS